MSPSETSFIYSFCKVEFLCFAGEPNWLGFLVIGIGIFIVWGFGLLFSFALHEMFGWLYILASMLFVGSIFK